MPLLNYTTKVPASRTINEIQKMLAVAGARQVLTEFGPSGKPVAIAFAIETQHTRRAPVPPPRRCRSGSSGHEVRRHPEPLPHPGAGRASRVAHHQGLARSAARAIVATQMVAFDQVMLPYMAAGGGGRTVYDLYLDQQLALPQAGAS